MALQDIFVITPGTKKIILVMLCLSLLGLGGAYLYYRDLNRREDPRVVEAKLEFKRYNDLVKENQYGLALNVLEHIESIYLRTPGYEDSFEMGVVYNNKGSIYLIELETKYLTKAGEEDAQAALALLSNAKKWIEKSIEVYQTWLGKMGTLNREEIRQIILPYFDRKDSRFNGYDVDKIIEKRIDDVIQAQKETPRRLSVSYTNLGVIARYGNQPEEAKRLYEKAIALWEDNFTAENNLRVLHGQPIKKRNIIDQLFPKDR